MIDPTYIPLMSMKMKKISHISTVCHYTIHYTLYKRYSLIVNNFYIITIPVPLLLFPFGNHLDDVTSTLGLIISLSYKVYHQSMRVGT